MSEIKGTNIAAPVVPFTTDDQYPTHYARYGCGGRMTGINSIAERDAIPSGLRELNMEVPIGDTIWTLKKGLTNADWETVQNTGGISEPDADGKPYSRMRFPGQNEGEWVESTAKIPMRNGIEYTGTYYDVYMDAVNGDDNSVNPNNPATPLKTLDGAFAFITNRDFLGGYVRFRFKPGTYNISTLNNYITLSQFNSCGITQIYLQSELYINSSTYDETVILPKIGISNTIVGISVAGVKIRNTASGSVAILCNAPVSVSLYDCAIESNNTMISAGQGSGYISLTTVRFIPTVATLKQLMSTSDGSIRLNRNCSVENAVTVTNATVVSTGGTIEVNTGFTSGLNLVTGNKIDITGGGSIIYIGSIAGTDPASLIPGSTYGFNGRSTDFSNPDNLENAPDFITDGTGSAYLSDNGQYAPVVLEPTADGKPYMRVRGTGQEIGQWYESTAKIPMRKGIEYTGTYYDVYINATSGDDNSPNPNDPATPFRTINSLNGFLSVRDFYGGNVRIRLSSGNYEASYAATGSKFYSTRSLVNSTIGTLTITSESYITTPNNYYEDVIFPRLELAGIAVLLSGIRISPTTSLSAVAIAYIAGHQQIIQYCVLNAGGQQISSVSNTRITCDNVKFRCKNSSFTCLITVGEGYINLANCILDNSNVLTITDATIVATSAASIKVSTGFTAGLDKVIGNRVNIAGSSFITYTGSIAGTDPVSLIPGSAPGFNGRSTGFSNPDNLENAPAFTTDGTGSKFLTDSGKYVESAVPGVNVRKILRRGIDYPNIFYRIYIDPASGDDNNEGQTVATPIKTIEKAAEIVNMHDFGNASSVHLFFLSSFPSNIDVSKFNVIGGPALFITASSQAVSVGSIIGMTNVELSIGNITIIAAENYPCVVGQIGRRLSLNNTSFKINGTYGAIYAKSYGNYTISLRGALTVVCESGNVSNFIDADNATIYHMSNTTINFSTPVNFTDAYIKLGKNSTYYNNTANIIYQNTGNVTGKKYIIESGSAAHNIDLSRLPGTIDGIYCYGTTFTNPETIEKFSEDENGQLLWNGDSISKMLKVFSGDPEIYTFSNLDITTGYGIYYMKTTTNDVVFPVANLNEHLEVGREITIYWECGYVNEEDSITRLRFPNPALGEIDFGYTMTTGAKGYWTMEAGTYYFKVYKKPDGILNIMVLPKPQWP